MVKNSCLATLVVSAVAGANLPCAQVCTVRTEHKVSGAVGGFAGPLDAEDLFGASVAALGDLDGDGIKDLAVGARRDDDGGADHGAVWILFLNPDGTVKADQKISETSGGFVGAVDLQFGVDVASLGDLDGDNVVDLAVGTIASSSDTGDGAVWILFLNTNGTVKGEQKISETAGGFGGDLTAGDGFGLSVASLGDLDGDGVADLAVGARKDDDGGTDQGAVWILLLNANGTVKSEQKISETAGGFGGVLDPVDDFGESVAGLGDVDGDGVPDLAVGTEDDDDGGTDEGAVWVLFLNANGTVKSQQKISATTGGFSGALDPSDFFGTSVGALGDLDNDGVPDLAAGAYGDDDGGGDQGAVWILFLNTNGTVKRAQKVSETMGGFGGALDPFDRFGISVAALGDVNGDGVIDLAAGAELDDDGGIEQGAVWILFLKGVPDTKPGNFSAHGSPTSATTTPAAVSVPRVGAMGSPVVFHEKSPALIGHSWRGAVSFPGVQRSVMFVGTAATSGIVNGMGEVLVGSPLPFRRLDELSLEIPHDPRLIGMQFSAQAAIQTADGWHLTNALDITIGRSD